LLVRVHALINPGTRSPSSGTIFPRLTAGSTTVTKRSNLNSTPDCYPTVSAIVCARAACPCRSGWRWCCCSIRFATGSSKYSTSIIWANTCAPNFPGDRRISGVSRNYHPAQSRQ